MVHSGGRSGLGREIVLGLLVERPASCYQLDVQLRGRFSAFEYAPGTARQAVKGLLDQGLVQIVQPGRRGLPVSARGAKLYEATPAGQERFWHWLTASISVPPVREELDARIALCRPEDLPRMVELVREAEVLCLRKAQGVNLRLRARQSENGAMGWQQRMDFVVGSGDQAWWESRIRWLQKLRVHLEREMDDDRARGMVVRR